MLFEFLDNLRKKPVAVRRRITFGVSLCLTLVVFSLWWNSFSARERFATRGGNNTAAVSALSPASALGETLQSGKALLIESLTALKALSDGREASSTIMIGTDELISRKERPDFDAYGGAPAEPGNADGGFPASEQSQDAEEQESETDHPKLP